MENSEEKSRLVIHQQVGDQGTPSRQKAPAAAAHNDLCYI